jgi:hypothetical protein
MPFEFDPDHTYFRIRLLGTENAFPSLLDVSSFLYDFNLTYEIARLATDSKYSDFMFSRYTLFRKGRPLEEPDRLHVEHLSVASPFDLVTIIKVGGGAISALVAVFSLIEKITGRPFNWRKLRAEAERVKQDNQGTASSDLGMPPEDPEQVLRRLHIREANTYYDNIGGRLRRSSVRIREIDVEVIKPRRMERGE